MTLPRGYTLIELLVATAVMLTIVAALSALVHDGLVGFPVLEEAADLHQRTRMAAEAIQSDVRAAGAGGPFGSLMDVFAPLLPRLPHQGLAVALPTVLTVLYVPPGGATSRLAARLDEGVPTALIEAVSGCPASAVACGFNTDVSAVVFDDSGRFDVLDIEGIGPGWLAVADRFTSRSASYPAGSPIVEVVVVTYTLDATARQLRRQVGDSMFPLADNVTGLTFSYFDSSLSNLPLSRLIDGPFRGSGLMMFDDDLRQVRGVRVTLRLETGLDTLRGSDPRLFARPGRSGGRRMLPDVETTFAVTVRNRGGS